MTRKTKLQTLTTSPGLNLINPEIVGNDDLSRFYRPADIITRKPAETSDTAAKRETATAASDKPKPVKVAYGEKLAGIIQKCRLSALFNPYEPEILRAAAAAWLEIFLAAFIPLECVNDCYVAAKKRRQKLINDGQSAPAIDADFIVAQWFATVREKHERKNSGRRLAAKLQTSCPDCFGNATRKKFRALPGGGREMTDEFCLHENLPPGDDDE